MSKPVALTSRYIFTRGSTSNIIAILEGGGKAVVKRERKRGGKEGGVEFPGDENNPRVSLGKFLDSSNSQEEEEDSPLPFSFFFDGSLVSYGMLRLKLARRNWKKE